MAVTGTFTATGQSATFNLRSGCPFVASPFNVSIWGTLVPTVQLQRSFDKGTTWLPRAISGAAAYTWTAPASEIVEDNEPGVQYRLNCTAFTSGTVNYRLGGPS